MVDDNIYPLVNICRLGPDTRAIQKVPNKLVVTGIFLAAVLYVLGAEGFFNSNTLRFMSGVLFLCGFSGLILNFVYSREFGILISLNSGKDIFLPMRDRKGVSDIMAAILDIIESSSENRSIRARIHSTGITLE